MLGSSTCQFLIVSFWFSSVIFTFPTDEAQLLLGDFHDDLVVVYLGDEATTDPEFPVMQGRKRKKYLLGKQRDPTGQRTCLKDVLAQMLLYLLSLLPSSGFPDILQTIQIQFFEKIENLAKKRPFRVKKTSKWGVDFRSQ